MRLPKVKPGEYVVAIRGLPLPPSRDSWQPVKDLLRNIMVKKPDEIHTEPGAVNMSPTEYGLCFCTIKDERAARKVCKWLDGNSWYKYELTVNLFHCALGKVESQQLQHGGGSFDEPQQLELISPIKDTSLLRPAPLMPSRSPNMSRTATVPPSPGRSRSYAFTSGHSSSMSNGYHSRSSSISTSSMYDSANNVIDYMKVPLMQSPVLVGGQLNHPNLALAQQNVAHCAYQGFRNDRSGRIGQACSPSADYNLVLGTASPTAASAMHRGYDVATVPRYAATYSMPVASTSATLDYSYHANPDGTLVNTAQGVISVSESRAVVIRNLNHRASPEDVQVHFRPAGIIEHCDIGAPRNDKKKCTATITFRNAEEAKSAVRRFNGTKFQGRPISAEIAKDDSAIGRGRALSDVAATRTDELTVTRTVSRRKPGQGPLIVNGSDEGPVYEPATSSSQKSRGKEKDKAEVPWEATGKMEKLKISR